MTDPVFFSAARSFSAGEIAALTGATLVDPRQSAVLVSGVAPASERAAGKLVYVEGRQAAALASKIDATAVLCPASAAASVPEGVAVLASRQPRADFAHVSRLMFPSAARLGPVTGDAGISPRAFVHPSARLEEGVTVEAGAIVSADAAIGAGTVVGPNAVIGRSCQIGRDCYIGPNVTLQFALLGNRVVVHPNAAVGQDGFGYVPDPSGLAKVPQLGRVILQDDVEIGAQTAIDRGALGDTVIGEGSKIDNLVQVGHNCRIGRFCIVAGHCGISGSVTLGDFVMLGGGAGIADHVTIGAGAQVAAGSGLMNDVPAGERWAGLPAQPFKAHFREVAVLRALVKERKRKGGSDE